jgi:hypothetical protein
MVELVIAHRLTEELRAATDQVAAGDPDAPAWEAELRSRRLLAAIAALLASLRRRRAVSARPSPTRPI